MPILMLQRQLRQLGRIRTGQQVASADGKKRRPTKLETFRLTSKSRDLIEAAAEAYGGTVTPWQNPGGGPEFEVITTTPVLDIIIPPGQPVSQWMEMWSGGGCQRRCDGVTNVLTMGACLCPPDVEQRLELAKDGQACKTTTRLSIMLPALPDLGVWLLEAHGYYAAVELAGAAEILAMATATGRLIPARLRLDQREKKVPGQPTNRYAVPVIEFIETRMADLALPGATRPQLVPGQPLVPALPPTALPATSAFRAPLASSAPETPLAAATPPEADERTRTAAEGSAAVSVALTRPQLLERLAEARIDPGYAAETARRMYPDAGGHLTDAQRGALLTALLAETAEIDAAAGL